MNIQKEGLGGVGREIIVLDNDKVWFTGDVHGRLESLVWEIKERKRLRNCTVVVVGDIGLGFESKRHYYPLFEKLNNKLRELGVTILLLRGNHDDGDFFNTLYYLDEYEKTPRGYVTFSNIMTIPDYTIIKTPSHNMLCVGGAVSIDRCKRQKGISYWENEKVMEWEEGFFDKLKEQGNLIDVVVTHTSPHICYPIDKSYDDQGLFIEQYSVYDEYLKHDNWSERQMLFNIMNILLKEGHPLSYWIYGHFHQNFKMIEDVDGHEIKFVALDMYRQGKVRDKINDVFRIGCEWFRIGDKSYDKEYMRSYNACRNDQNSTHQ